MSPKRPTAGSILSSSPPRIAPAGDTALVVTLGDVMDRAVSRRVLALGARIMTAAKQGLVEPGLLEVVPGMTSLTVHFDPDVLDADALTTWLAATASEHDETVAGLRPRRWRVPVCYDPAFALDLDEVASRTGLTTDAVIARHSGTDYHVYMLGFLPGFPYLGDLDAALRLPRRDTPRVAVPAGAVAIAGAMTAIYPAESPGGWHVIGRTPVRLFDVAGTEPAVLVPGDSVRFCAVGRAEFERLEGDVRAGRWTLVPEDPAQHGDPG